MVSVYWGENRKLGCWESTYVPQNKRRVEEKEWVRQTVFRDVCVRTAIEIENDATGVRLQRKKAYRFEQAEYGILLVTDLFAVRLWHRRGDLFLIVVSCKPNAKKSSKKIACFFYVFAI